LSEHTSYARPYEYPFFDPVISINSGQTFLWEKRDNSWYGIYGDHILKLFVSSSQIPSGGSKSNKVANNLEMHFSSYPQFQSWERHVFRLNDNLSDIFSSFDNDVLISESINKYPGLRLMRQEPFQCMVSFACASNTNIPMIRRMLKNLCQNFGNRVIVDGNEFFTFPSVERLSTASQHELLRCGLGYRTKAVKAIAESVVNGSLDARHLLRLDYEEAKDELLKVYGIGNKIADCILLFSLEKLNSFPIDVWMARVLYQNYGWLFNNNQSSRVHNGKTLQKITALEYRTVSKSAREYFGKYSGYAQQYLYYNIRQIAGRKW
jgi:N-glycosylase/DNA lyase